MELHLVDRCSIGEMHIIIKTENIFEGSCLSCAVVHSTCPLVPMVRLVPMDLHLVDGVPLVKCISL